MNAASDLLWNRRLTAAVIVAAAVLYSVRLGDRALASEEVRWAEVAREMRQTGDYLHPTINGRPYPDKPAGSYWLIVLASHLTGGVDETAARLPAAVAGVAGVWAVILLGRRLYDARTGLYAGAVLATSFGYAVYARRATADVETTTGVLAAVGLYAACRDRPGRAWVVGLWLWMAVVSLTKGLLGFALPLAVFAADGLGAVWAGERRATAARSRLAAGLVEGRWLFNPWTLVAVPLAAGVYLLPFVSAGGGGAEGLEMVWRENVRRFFAPHNHRGPVYLYAGVVFVLAGPWSAFLPAAVVPPAAPGGRGDRLARAYFWAVFVFFTASASRRSYYLLPALPAVALLIGRVLAADRGALRKWASRLRAAGWAVSGTVFLLSGLTLLPPAWALPPPYDRLPPLPNRAALLAGWLLGLVAVAGTALRPNRGRTAAAATGVLLALLYFFAVADPAADDLRPRRDFLAAVRRHTSAAPDGLALFHASDVVFDLGRTAPEFTAADELAAAVRAGRVRWIVAPRRHLAGVTLPAALTAEEATHPWESADRVANKLVLLEATP